SHQAIPPGWSPPFPYWIMEGLPVVRSRWQGRSNSKGDLDNLAPKAHFPRITPFSHRMAGSPITSGRSRTLFCHLPLGNSVHLFAARPFALAGTVMTKRAKS